MKSRRNWVWFLIKFLPVIYCFVGIVGYTFVFKETGTVFSFTDLRAFLYNLSNAFVFSPLTSVLYNIYQGFTGTILLGEDYAIITFVLRYISYLVFVEIFRIIYEVLVFLPKFANSFWERKMGD